MEILILVAAEVIKMMSWRDVVVMRSVDETNYVLDSGDQPLLPEHT